MKKKKKKKKLLGYLQVALFYHHKKTKVQIYKCEESGTTWSDFDGTPKCYLEGWPNPIPTPDQLLEISWCWIIFRARNIIQLMVKFISRLIMVLFFFFFFFFFFWHKNQSMFTLKWNIFSTLSKRLGQALTAGMCHRAQDCQRAVTTQDANGQPLSACPEGIEG